MLVTMVIQALRVSVKLYPPIPSSQCVSIVHQTRVDVVHQATEQWWVALIIIDINLRYPYV